MQTKPNQIKMKTKLQKNKHNKKIIIKRNRTFSPQKKSNI